MSERESIIRGMAYTMIAVGLMLLALGIGEALALGN